LEVLVSKLFSPLQINPDLALSHRVVMAPLTRLRSEAGDIPGDLMVEYYGQRASAGGLIIAEATPVVVTGRAYLGAPGIYNDSQVAGWKRVVDAVHAKGGKIFLQLWHVGRTSHVDLSNGQTPVSASESNDYSGMAFTPSGWVATSPARALKIEEIPGIVEAFRKGAERAKAAGFDGAEIHGANGYLIDQFLQDGSNKRTDIYGGSPENRARLLLEVTRAVASVWGFNRTGVRIAPSGKWNGMSDSNPQATFGYVAKALAPLGLAYLHVVDPRVIGSEEAAEGLPAMAAADLRKFYKGAILAAGGFDGKDAENVVSRGDADMVAFGRHFIANPDLPARIRQGLPLNPYDRSSFYGGDHRGYTDYPFSRSPTHKSHPDSGCGEFDEG
jgi:N-ethylmaleimide reductase